MLIASTNYPETRHALGLKTAGARGLLSRAIANSIMVLSAKRPANKILRGSSKVCLLKGEAILYWEASVHMLCVCVCSRQGAGKCVREPLCRESELCGESNVVTAAPFLHFPVLHCYSTSPLFCSVQWMGMWVSSVLFFLLRAFSAVLVLKCLHYCV